MIKTLVDINKFRTPKTYAKDYDFSIQYVYRMIKDKKLKTKSVDGVTFIVV